jgi:hypothetical protein
MDLCKFLHFGETCPICGNTLKLYLYTDSGPLWKGSPEAHDTLSFKQVKFLDSDLNPDDAVHITDYGDNAGIDFSNRALLEKFQNWEFFFFFICNEEGIVDKSYNTYALNPYLGCYYRSSPFVRLKLNNHNEAKLVISESDGLFELPDNQVRNETCLFKVNSGELEKIYLLDLDYQAKRTVLRYYSTTETQRAIEDFEPKTFKKELPLLGRRPDFNMTRRDALIDRLNNWILMS